MKKRALYSFAGIPLLLIFFNGVLGSAAQDFLGRLGQQQNYVSKRISSYDATAGNTDSIAIEPGATAVLAEIRGPAAIHHIWLTIAAEPFYGRKIILRIYWDGEDRPSVEAPIGDFFGVGHGLNRNFSSLPINCSSEGRARNCYWYMPFRHQARLTVTNEGKNKIHAFYYHVDYRELRDLSPDVPYFHAQYLQEMPCQPGKNYLILDAAGRGHYIGCNMSILQRSKGWWGEGDDMICVDGEETPSLHGTGSEGYFSGAWGMRQDENLFYGCPLQEDDFQVGSKATVYRFHIPDPVPFQESIQVTIEHGHANERSDYFSSVAYWYQREPHKPFPSMPSVEARLPYALETPQDFILPKWEETKSRKGNVFEDKEKGLTFRAEKLSLSLTPYYGPDGSRFPILTTENARERSQAELSFPVDIKEHYDIALYFLKGPANGNLEVSEIRAAGKPVIFEAGKLEGSSREKEIGKLTLKNVLLRSEMNRIPIKVTGKNADATGMEISFIGLSLSPSERKFISEWNLIGPFDAPDMTYLQTAYPPEAETALDKKYPGKSNVEVGWQKVQAEKNGCVRLTEVFKPNEQVIIYGLAYVYSPEASSTHLLLGSDDGVRVWLNDALVHTNPACRGSYPDQDKVKVQLKKGWNKVLIKVLQGSGGWGFYLRFADPDSKLLCAAEPQK